LLWSNKVATPEHPSEQKKNRSCALTNPLP